MEAKSINRKKVFEGIFVICSLIIGQQAFGWGATGHRLVAEVAAEISGNQTFWEANENNMGVLANVPDRNWKNPKTAVGEKPTHYFEPDGFVTNISDFVNFPVKWIDAMSKYGEQTLVSHGTAIWRVQQLRDKAIAAALSGNYVEALETAGTMSHYIGDLSQPLHVTVNYDGQQTNQTGIHKFFETTNLENRDYQKLKGEIAKLAESYLKDPQFISQNSNLTDMVMNSVVRSYDHLQTVLDLDKQDGRSGRGADEMLEVAKERVADAAAVLSLVLSDIWKQAGSPQFAQSVKITTPSWIAPDYSNTVRMKHWEQARQVSFFNNNSDDSSKFDCE